MDQVFNELSLSASLADSYTAHNALLNLKKASDKLIGLGFSPNIRVTEDFNTRCITPNCTIHDYLRRPVGGQERTLQQLLLRRFTGAPYVEYLCTESEMTILEDYVMEEEICKGLALAFLWNIPALSLEGDARFVPPFATLTHSSLEKDGEEISKEECQVGIISREDDIVHHEEAIKTVLYEPITTGEELLNYARRWLPRLVFSQVAKEQLMKMQKGYLLLPRIRAILDELQRAIQEAIEEQKPFSPHGFKYTPAESDTATQGKKGQKHTFNFEELDKQGRQVTVSKLCEAHMYITDGDRVYFICDLNKEVVYVGHIGAHLPGKKYG